MTTGFLQLLGRKPAPTRDKRKPRGKNTEERQRAKGREGREHPEMLAHPRQDSSAKVKVVEQQRAREQQQE